MPPLVEVRQRRSHEAFGVVAEVLCPGSAAVGEDMLGPEVSERAFVEGDIMVYHVWLALVMHPENVGVSSILGQDPIPVCCPPVEEEDFGPEGGVYLLDEEEFELVGVLDLL